MTRDPDLERRLAFMNLSDADVARLAVLRPQLEKHADALVAAFYRHLLSFEPTRKTLSDPEVRERLTRAQRSYLISLGGTRIDDDYVEERLRIGEAHNRVNLDLRWYLGAYALYHSLIQPMIEEFHADDPHKAAETIKSLNKVLVLDAQLAMEAYIEARERKLGELNVALAARGRGLEREVDEQREALHETTERARAAEQLASVGTLAAGLAHEIGTPMGVIRGHAELLDSSVSDERGRWRLSTIVEQIDRIAHIMEALLNLARPHKSQRVPVCLEQVVDTALSFLTEKLRHRAIEVERDFDPCDDIQGDPEKLQQLFLNLFLNAADAMPDGGVLRVALRPANGSQVSICVSDTGTGIPERDLDQIFEPFFTSKQAGQGSGLGLVVTSGIVNEHGGELTVESEVGRGTTFCITLPMGGIQPNENAPRS